MWGRGVPRLGKHHRSTQQHSDVARHVPTQVRQ